MRSMIISVLIVVPILLSGCVLSRYETTSSETVDKDGTVTKTEETRQVPFFGGQ